MSSWSGKPSIRGNSEVVRLTLLTFVSIGITFTWGVEMTYCTPYLLSLGLTKSQASFVWIAGPVSGLIVQPIVGTLADESKSKFGRRRPIIVVGSVIVALSLLCLGFTKEIVSHFIVDKDAAKVSTIALAVLSLCSVDFAINAVMSCARSLVVDTLDISRQQQGAAMNSRMGALGHVIGYAMGAVDLVSILGTSLGDTQFKVLTVISALSMLGTSAVTCWAVTERVLVSVRHDPRRSQGHFGVVQQIWTTITHLPPRIKAICQVVFWSWIGWYPFIVYSSTWVGETYFRYEVSADSRSSKDVLGEVGRIGSAALTLYSSMTFLSAWILPMFVKSPQDDDFTHRPPASIAHWVEKINKVKPDLLTAWFCSQLLFACAMFLTPFATSFRFASTIVALCGIPWSIAMWAPTTFLGIEVNRLSSSSGSNASTAHRRSSNEGSSIELLSPGGDEKADAGSESTGELSGIYFGIVNIYTTVPQFMSTFISTIIFSILEPGKSPELATDAHPSEHHSTDGPNAISVSMFIGAMATLVGAAMTRKLIRLMRS
ncbi:hypothetical protein GQ53DRAFT_673317 [Thozetella sp. PMI_491]|nr:hypothetical protein GQ53DRAFT_673317 [Thozetella sp. PMI_491]